MCEREAKRERVLHGQNDERSIESKRGAARAKCNYR